MVYGIIRLINFAHGEVFMVGAFTSYYLFARSAVRAAMGDRRRRAGRVRFHVRAQPVARSADRSAGARRAARRRLRRADPCTR
ncbi:MAG: hypothetical protein U5J97_01990 [Trueperaceae bacterium]|nr:hypothetical protein [Trueperaceae bacterium]